MFCTRYKLESKPMLKTGSSGAPVSPGASVRAAEALFRARRAEILAAVVRQAEAGDRTAVRLSREHGLPVEPPPAVLAARLAESIERTRATVATLLAEGGLTVAKTRASATRFALAHPAGVQVDGGALVNNNENTSADADGDAASFGRK
jgi:hypothetical protein